MKNNLLSLIKDKIVNRNKDLGGQFSFMMK